MKLTWIGHSCFRIEKDGYSIVVDPYSDGSVPGLKPVRVSANKVFCSHLHADHAGILGVQQLPEADEIIHAAVLDSYHDEVNGAKRGTNKIHIFTDGECRVAHLGDLGCMPEDYQMEMLKNMDVLMIPVGGFFTIGAKEAAELVYRLQPKKVIPMHYRSETFGYDVLDTVDSFAEQMDHMTRLNASEFDTTSDIRAQVIILEPQNA